MSAPDRIWADCDPMHPEMNGGSWWGEDCKGHLYLRATPPANTPEELAEALGLIAGMVLEPDNPSIPGDLRLAGKIAHAALAKLEKEATDGTS